MSKLDKIRAILEEQEAARTNKGNFDSGPSPVFPFWKMETGSDSVVRFLPDGNSKNPLMYIENQNIRLSFPGIKGDSNQRPIEFKIPCVEMWGLSCPILGHIRKEKWFDDPDTKDLGSQYWKKRTWIFQGFVVENGVDDDEAPENPIRRFIMGRQLFDIIRDGLIDPELEESPDDYSAGTDFIIKKTPQAGTKFGSYTSSKFKRNPRALNEEELEAIEKYGLSDLATFQPKKPTAEELDELFDLFLSSVEGDLYDSKRFGHLPWRPSGVSQEEKVEARTETKIKETPSVAAEVQVEEVETKTAEKPKVSADEILARLRESKKAAE